MKVHIGYCENVILGEMVIVSVNDTNLVLNFKNESGFFNDIEWFSQEPYNYTYDGFLLRNEDEDPYMAYYEKENSKNIDVWNTSFGVHGYCELRVFDSEVYDSFISFNPDEFLNCLERKSKFFSYEDNNGNTLIGLFLKLNNYNPDYVDRLLRMKAKFSLKCLNYMIRLFPHYLSKMKEYGWFENPDHVKLLIHLNSASFFTIDNPEYCLPTNEEIVSKLRSPEEIRLELQNLGISI